MLSAQDAQAEMPKPVTPAKVAKPPCNAGAGHDNPDAGNLGYEDFSDEPLRKGKRTRVVKQKRERILIVYHAIKHWPMRERAEMDEEEVMAEVHSKEVMKFHQWARMY